MAEPENTWVELKVYIPPLETMTIGLSNSEDCMIFELTDTTMTILHCIALAKLLRSNL